MKQYFDLFIDNEYPNFIDKYLTTPTLKRLKHVTQFCGCDYTLLYSPLFRYTRFDHSLVVAYMTWHFTKSKRETVMALLHDIGTPCFAHCIDYVFGDYLYQVSSEKSVIEMIHQDEQLKACLKEDDLLIEDFCDMSRYPILENNSPKLCTDRLDGVLHTCYIWLHTHSLEQIKEVYDGIIVLENEDGRPEIGFQDVEVAEKFVSMVDIYARELRGNTDKYVMKYISEIVKLAFEKGLISLEDLYTKKEDEICSLFAQNFSSWKKFNEATILSRVDTAPKNHFFISFETKRRNTIPLVRTGIGDERISVVSSRAKMCYDWLEEYQDTPFAYVEGIELDCDYKALVKAL